MSYSSLWEQWCAGDERVGEQLLVFAEEQEPARLVQLAIVQQQREWHQGNRIRTETWFERYPALASDRDCAIDLVYAEYLLDSATGCANADEYVARFPELEVDLRRQFDLDHSFRTQPIEHDEQAGCPCTFGEYELLEVIARGGMGVVYKARQCGLGRLVALKMIKTGRFADPTAIQRFYVEARAAAELQHRSIVTVYEVGEVAGEHYYTMEFVPGSSLAELIREQPLSPRRAAGYVKSIAEAMQYAHERGILHRDLKPSNVVLDEQGEPRITDFGLARSIEAESHLTGSMEVLGTPSYMSPEQAAGRGDQVGPQSDVYSLGATLYDLLTGRPPFRAANAFDTRQQVLDTDPAAPRLLNHKVPRDLETICLKCLEKIPGKRYASASALADDLLQFLDDKPISARRTGKLNRIARWARRNPGVAGLTMVIATLLATVAIGSFLAAVSFRDIAEKQQRQLATNYQLLGNEHFEDQEIASGMMMTLKAYREASDPLQRRTSLNLLTGYGASLGRCLRHDSSVIRAYVSPDGTRFATGTEDGLVYIWNAEGRPETRLDTRQVWIREIMFGEDGQQVLVMGRDLNSSVVQLWDITAAEVVSELAHPAWNPLLDSIRFLDGQPIAAMQNTDQEVALWNIARRQPLNSFVMPHDERVDRACFHPQKPWLITAGKSGVLQIWNTEGGSRLAILNDSITPESPSDFEVYSHWKRIKGDDMDRVLAIAIDPQRNLLAVGSFMFLRLWDLNTMTLCTRALAHRASIFGLAFDASNERLASGSTDDTVAVWDTSKRSLSNPEVLSLGKVKNIEIADSGRRLMASTDACYVWFTLARYGEDLPLEPFTHEALLTTAIFGARQQTLLTADVEGIGRLRDLPEHPHRIRHERQVSRGAISTDNRLAATGEGTSAREDLEPRRTLIWELETGQLLHTLQHPAPISGVEFIDCDESVLTVCADGATRFWDVQSGQLLGAPLQQPEAIRALCVSRDGRLFATGDEAGMIRVWEVASRHLLWEQHAHSEAVIGLEFGPCGALLASGSQSEGYGGGEVRRWNARTGDAIGTPLDHGRATTGLAVSANPDHPLLAVASVDGEVHLFDLETGRPFGRPIRHTQDHVDSVQFTPDGNTLITTCGDHRVRFWDVLTQMPSAPPIRHVERLACMLDISSDGRKLLCGDGTPHGPGGGYIWELPKRLDDDPRRVELWVQTVTGMKRWNEETRHIEPLTFDEWLECQAELDGLGGPPFIRH